MDDKTAERDETASDEERAEAGQDQAPGLMVSVGERGGFAVPVQLNGRVLVRRGRR